MLLLVLLRIRLKVFLAKVREVPQIGTTDIALYAIAYELEKGISEVVFDNGSTIVTVDVESAIVETNVEDVLSLSKISQIDIPVSNIAYSFETIVLTSQEEYDSFINEEQYLEQFEELAIDFTTDNLLIYRFTTASGSDVLNLGVPEIIDGQLTVKIDLQLYDSSVVVEYALAYKLDKSLTNIVFDNGDEPVSLDIENL